MNQTSYGREGVYSEHLYARGPSRTSSGLICHTLAARDATSTYPRQMSVYLSSRPLWLRWVYTIQEPFALEFHWNLFIFAKIELFMGKIFEYFGFVFYFFSNEHEPVHIHVKKGSEECIFDLIIENGELVSLIRREKASADPLNGKDEKTAIDFINLYWKEIVEKWVATFVYKKAVSNTKITKKIK